ncbi:MAG: DUF2283 domain-containing protein [Acidiferrobacteraceae bacterium]
MGKRSSRVFCVGVRALKIRYFQETDTLSIEFRTESVVETKDLDEHTLLDSEVVRALIHAVPEVRARCPAFPVP